MRDPINDTLFPFTVGIVGPEGVMTTDELERLVELLVNRHNGTRKIIVVTLGGADAPELAWVHARRWSLTLACGDTPIKREFDLLSMIDALVVLGDPLRWRRLLAFAAEARLPIRVYRDRPRHLPPRQLDHEKAIR